MPKDKVANAISRATSSSDADNYQEVRYEGFAPGGAQVIVECLTDNNNRTFSEVRTIFNKSGARLGEQGAVSHSFNRIVTIYYPDSVDKEEAIWEAAIECGADDFQHDSEEKRYCIITSVEEMSSVKDELEKRYGNIESFTISWIPQNYISIEDQETREKWEKFLDTLEDHDDVQNVYRDVRE